MQRKYKSRLIILYGILPIVLFALLGNQIQVSLTTQTHQSTNDIKYAFPKWAPIIPVGIMTPETSGAIRDEYDVVYDVLNGLNIKYGRHLSIFRKTGSQATENGLKYLLKWTERTHVSSHGSYHQEYGPGVEMYDGYLYASKVSKWSISEPKSDLLFLSACESLGYNSHTENRLARAICEKTEVDMVIGYNDVVDSYSTIYIAHRFWYYLTRALEPYGGFEAHDCFDLARTQCQGHIDAMEAVASGGAAAIVALAGAAVGGSVGALLGAILGELAEDALLYLTVGDFIELQQKTHDAFEFYGETEVPALVWTGGGDPWGGDLPH